MCAFRITTRELNVFFHIIYVRDWREKSRKGCPTSHKEVGQFYSPWRVILLRSDIRLTPSDICFASFKANKISLKPKGFNITIAVAIISLRRSRNITLAFSANLCYNGVNERPLPLGEVAAKPTERVRLWNETPSHPLSRELSQRESLWVRATLGVWALP